MCRIESVETTVVTPNLLPCSIDTRVENNVHGEKISSKYHTSNEDKVDLPQPLVPQRRIVTDSFRSLILEKK